MWRMQRAGKVRLWSHHNHLHVLRWASIQFNKHFYSLLRELQNTYRLYSKMPPPLFLMLQTGSTCFVCTCSQTAVRATKTTLSMSTSVKWWSQTHQMRRPNGCCMLTSVPPASPWFSSSSSSLLAAVVDQTVITAVVVVVQNVHEGKLKEIKTLQDCERLKVGKL